MIPRRVRVYTGVCFLSIPASSFLIYSVQQQPVFTTPRRSLATFAMKSNSTDGNEGRSGGRLDSTASAEHVTELGVEEEEMVMEDMDEYCTVLDDFGCVAYEEVDPVPEREDDKKTRLIRVQAAEDDCLEDITSREDVWRKIHEVQKAQSDYGRSDLYERKWQSETHEESDINSIPINGEKARQSFTVMQFNALAEGLSSGPSMKTPFPCDSTNKDDEKNCYGGFTAIKHPEVALDFNLRRWRLLEVMLGSLSEKDNPPFDLIAMEEVDRYRGFFAPVLKYFGYQGIFVPKFRAPGIQLGWYSDGLALFWKTSTFELVSQNRLSYRIGNQAFIIATLRHKQSDRHVVVGITHLKARKSENNEKIRVRQVCELLDKLAEERQRVQSGSEKVPILILGDFNADPPSTKRDASCVAKVLDHHKLSKTSCPPYSSASPVDPPPSGYFTTWKTRGAETVKRVIDYIFHSNISCTDTLCIPDEKEIEVDQLPGLRYPSDHLMIAAKFDLE